MDILNDSRPGDIWNTSGGAFDWKHPFFSIGRSILVKVIKRTQASDFCLKMKPKDVPGIIDSHSTMYFTPSEVFSVQVPKPTFINSNEYTRDPKALVCVYRMNPAYFTRELRETDLIMLREGCNEIIRWGNKYDMGQNVDILINTIAGYPWKDRTNLFDAGPKRLVCSVGVATVIAYWRHRLFLLAKENIPQPWKVLNPQAWPEKLVKAYPGHWDISTTYPANFSVTETHFNHEFILIGKYRGGNRVG